MSAHEKSRSFEIEAVLREHANVQQLLELDGILVNLEIDESVRTAQAHAFIEKFVDLLKE